MWAGIAEFFGGTTLGRYLITIFVIIALLVAWPSFPGDILGFVWERLTFALGHLFDKGKELFQWIIFIFVLYLWSRAIDHRHNRSGGGGGGHS